MSKEVRRKKIKLNAISLKIDYLTKKKYAF